MRLGLEQPLDIDEARRANRRLAELRHAAEDELDRAVRLAAEKERDYRKALSSAFVKNAGFDGTAAAREARSRADAAQESYERDLAEGMVKVAIERLRGLEREGAALRSLTEWSQRMYEREEPANPTTYGRRAA